MLAAGLIVAGLLFHQLVALVLALVLSAVFAVLLSAIADRLERLGVPRVLGALVGLCGALAIWAAIFALLIPPFTHEVRVLSHSAPGLVAASEAKLHHFTGISAAAVSQQAQGALQGLVRDPTRLLGTVASLGRGAAEAVGGLVLVSLAAYYMAVRPHPLISGLLRLFPLERRGDAAAVLGRIHDAWFGWCRGLAINMVITGTLTYVALRLIEVPFAFVFAVLTAALLVVPFLGAIASAVPAVLVALTVSPGKALAVVCAYLLIHQFEAHVINPLVMGRNINLHPALLAFGVVIIDALVGPVGLVVAVPLLSVTAVLVEELWMRPLDGQSAVAAH